MDFRQYLMTGKISEKIIIIAKILNVCLRIEMYKKQIEICVLT